MKKPACVLKKHLNVTTLSLILTVLISFSKAQVTPAIIPYDTPNYGTDNSVVTTNCDTRKVCGDILRITVWDGATSGLHWIFGSTTGNIAFQNVAVEPDVSIIQDANGSCLHVLVVYAKIGMGTAQYFYEAFKFTCPIPGVSPASLTLYASGLIDPATTNDVGIHVDADESGNFAIAYSIGTLTTNKIWTVIGTFDCTNGLIFCATPYMINPAGAPVKQTDPDVCIQKANEGSSAIKYSYLDFGHTLLCVQGEKHPGTPHESCFDPLTPPPNSIVYTYAAQINHKLYSPRIAAPKNYFSSSLGDDYTVVFLERSAAEGWLIRGYTWKWPAPAIIPLCPTSSPACNGVKTYNDGNGNTSPSSSFPAPNQLKFYESEYPVVTYTDENSCRGIIIGWNVRYPAPGSGGIANWDPITIQLNIDGQTLYDPYYHQVPQGPLVARNQKALSIAGRFSDNGNSSVQHSLYELNMAPPSIRGKFTRTCPIVLRQAVSVSEQQNTSTQLSVFPNPADHHLTISLPDVTKTGKLVVYNILGTAMKEVIINAGESEMEIDTESLSPGSYFIQLKANDNTIIGKGTFVKQ